MIPDERDPVRIIAQWMFAVVVSLLIAGCVFVLGLFFWEAVL